MRFSVTYNNTTITILVSTPTNTQTITNFHENIAPKITATNVLSPTRNFQDSNSNSNITTGIFSEEPTIDCLPTDIPTTFSINIENDLKYSIDLKKGENSLELNFYKVNNSSKKCNAAPWIDSNIVSNTITPDITRDKNETSFSISPSQRITSQPKNKSTK